MAVCSENEEMYEVWKEMQKNFDFHDKRGKHQGEYSWKGTHKESKEKHDIRVK